MIQIPLIKGFNCTQIYTLSSIRSYRRGYMHLKRWPVFIKQRLNIAREIKKLVTQSIFPRSRLSDNIHQHPDHKIKNFGSKPFIHPSLHFYEI